MSTKIELGFPFNEDFKAGYLNINKEPRRVVSLIKKSGGRTSMSYARYLMTCKLERYLSDDECVDHIDNDKLNDTIDNLQILTTSENNRKKLAHLGIKLEDPIQLVCPVCNTVFVRPAGNIKNKLKNGKKPTCSRTCGGKHSHTTALLSALAHNQLKP